MSMIQISGLTFCYDGSYDTIFEDVTLTMDTDWKLGLTGRNGRGKTTFLKLLLGKYEYQGNISASVEFEYFPFAVNNPQENTLDVISAIFPEYVHWELLRELSLLEVAEDVLYRPFSTLSNGERTKVLLATLFLKENRFLLIDEPTNHLDMHGRKTVASYLRMKKGFILVSHDRAFLDDSVDHILSINRANIEIQQGNFSQWWENKQRQDNFELAQNRKLQKDIQRLSASAKQAGRWSNTVEKSKIATRNSGLRPDKGYIGHKAAKMMKRSKSIENRQNAALEDKKKLLKNLESMEDLSVSPLMYLKKQLVVVENLALFYHQQQICAGVSFSIEQGDRIALQGRNGSGKSSLLKLLCGQNIAHTGLLQTDSQLKISYVSQDASHLAGDLCEYARQYAVDESQLKTILCKLGFERLQFEKDMADFSAGQKKKVLLARSLCEKAHLYIWDEPLNYIDIYSRIQIEELIQRNAPTLLFVEHDSDFCQQIKSKEVVLHRTKNR